MSGSIVPPHHPHGSPARDDPVDNDDDNASVSTVIYDGNSPAQHGAARPSAHSDSSDEDDYEIPTPGVMKVSDCSVRFVLSFMLTNGVA